jgi:molybdenum cofactor cytidylyltransferase
VIAIVLAAGKSSRMGRNKMLADFHGMPMVSATLSKVLQSSVDHVVVVTGHQHELVAAEAAKLGVTTIYNPDYADGLSTSLVCGLRGAIAQRADAVIVCLADMPLVEGKLIDRLIAAYSPVEHRTIVVPTFMGQFGNPVLWGGEHFDRLLSLAGDQGARTLIEELKSEAVEIDAGNDSVLRDADTPAALQSLSLSNV